MADLEGFDERYPLNSRLVKRDGRLVEEVYRVGGRYDRYIREIVRHLEAADAVSPPSRWRRRCDALIRFYETGETADRDRVRHRLGPGPRFAGRHDQRVRRGLHGRARHEGGVGGARLLRQSGEDRGHPQARRRGAVVRGPHALGGQVQEAGRPRRLGQRHRRRRSRPETRARSRRSGINLPNDQAIREQHGSKSVSLSNANEAYDKSTLPEFRREFAWSAEEAERAEKWSSVASELTTDMHEVIGHGSGRISEQLQGNPQARLKEQYSALEESRADLVALYFVPDPKLVELGLVDEEDHAEIVRAEYEGYARNALVQLRRVREGTQIEEDHMRNRQMIVGWLMANSAAIERPPPRRQDLLRHGRRRGVPGGRRPAARRGPADQGGRGLRGGEGAVRDLRHPLRSGAPRRGGRPRRPAADAVLHRLRPAPPRGRARRPTARSPTSTISYPLDLTRRCWSTPARR